MLEYITFLTYLYTRLDPILHVLSVSFWLSFIIIIISSFIYGMVYDSCWDSVKFSEEYKPLWKRTLKICVVTMLCSMLAKTIIPNKEDALLIAGVTVGASVAEKTIDSVSKSETMGKVFEIVQMKVDKTLDEMKKEKK